MGDTHRLRSLSSVPDQWPERRFQSQQLPPSADPVANCSPELLKATLLTLSY